MENLVNDITELHKNRFQLLKEIDRPKIGWLSIYTPLEIIEAAGAVPYRITGETMPNAVQASGYMHRNVCPYVLSCFEEALRGTHDFGDGAVIVNACDGRRRLYDVWRYFLDTKVTHFLDMPKAVNQDTKKYFRNEFLKLIKMLEETYDCKITEEKIKESISTHNETRRLLKKLYDLRKTETPPIAGSQAIQIVKSAMIGFNKEFNLKLEKLLDKLAEEPESEAGGSKGPRVLICGSYFDHIEVAELLEQTGAQIVCEDISNGVKYFDGSVDLDKEPVEALADYYLEKATCARMINAENRFNHMWNLIEEYKADSVVYFSLKFCDSNLIDFSYQKEQLRNKNVPVLFLEIERSTPNMEQIKTRVQTFIETQMP